MKVSQLISQLKKMPQNVEVGYAHSDNGEYECAGWCDKLYLFKKEECDQSRLCGADERSMFDSMPEECVIIRG